MADKAVGAGLNKLAENQKAEAAKNGKDEEKLLDSWWLTKSYIAVYKISNKIELWALKRERLELIGKTEYILDMDKY